MGPVDGRLDEPPVCITVRAETREPTTAQQSTVQSEPVKHLVEQARVAPRNTESEDEKCFRVLRPDVAAISAGEDSHLRPLAPGEFDKRRLKVGSKR